MKKKVYQSVALIISAIFCVNMGVCAQGTINVTVDTDTNRITVSGNLEECKDKAVTILQLKPDAVASDLVSVTNSNIMEYVDYADAQLTDENGNYSFSYINNGIDGKYTVRVTSLDKQYALEKEYLFSGYALKNLKNSINTAKAEKNITAMIEQMKAAYAGFDTSCAVFDCTPEAIKTKYEEIVAKILIEKSVLNKISEFLPQFEEAALAARTNIFTDKADFDSFIETYGAVTGVEASTAYIKTFKTAEETVQNKIRNAFIQNGGELKYKTVEEFRKMFEEKTILISIQESNGWGSVQKVLSDNKDLITDASGASIQIEKGNTEIYKALERKNFASLKDLKAEFDNLAAQSSVASETPGTTGGGGGGGSSAAASSLSVGFAVPTIITQSMGAETNNTVSGFTDLKNFDWAKSSIERLKDKNIIAGIGDNKFAPEKTVTRSEFVKMLVLAVNKYNPDAQTAFSDINEDDWQYRYISSAYESGIIFLDESKVFGTNNAISREDMAAMCFRAINKLGLATQEASEVAEFSDMETVSEYAKESVLYLKKIGVINGMTPEIFSPKTDVNRAQAAVIIDRLLDVIGETK
ncbi:MAG: S-layer homology domain-containing protein [Clostridia bacterium]|nr:S-layer homology domain-containing protein [Clostridia bacterium]